MCVIRLLTLTGILVLLHGACFAQYNRNHLPEPRVEKVDFRLLKQGQGLEWDLYSQYSFDGAVRIQGVYPRGKYSTWEYDIVYSFEHASDHNPAYYSKNKYGIQFSENYTQSLIDHVVKRNAANFYSRRHNTINWELFNAQLKSAFKRLALGNIHVVGWEPELEEKVRGLKPSDVVEISGYLVDVRSSSREKWIAKSSVVLGLPDDYSKVKDHRDFYGCEIIWITDLEIYREKEGLRTMYFGGTPVQTKGMMDPLEVYWKEYKSRKKSKEAQAKSDELVETPAIEAKHEEASAVSAS